MLTFGAAISTAPDHQQALDEAIPAALDQLGGAPDLVVCFFSMEHAGAAAGIALSLSERTGTSAILGCTAQGVIGDGRELEEAGPGRLDGQSPSTSGRSPCGCCRCPTASASAAGPPARERPYQRAAAGRPFTFPADSFLERLNSEEPGLPGRRDGLGGAGTRQAPAAVRHRGARRRRQGRPGRARRHPGRGQRGCRPVGSPFAVTRGEGNIVHELGGRPAVDRLRQLLASLDQHEQAAAGGGKVGQVIDEHKASFDRGDFLVRGLLGADPETGSIAVGDSVEVGQTLQFHIRDAAATRTSSCC